MTAAVTDPATYYDALVVIARGDEEGREPTTFCVADTGFPINYEVDHEWEQFWSADDLTSGYFAKLAADPDSPLVGYLAYIVRNPPVPD